MDTKHMSAIRYWLIGQAVRDLGDAVQAELQTDALIAICAGTLTFTELQAELTRRAGDLEGDDDEVRRTPQQQALEQQEAEAEILAWLTYYYAESRGRRPWGRVKEKGIQEQSEAALPRFRLLQALAQAEGCQLEELSGDLPTLNSLLPRAQEFVTAIKPKRLKNLVLENEFRPRLFAWFEQRTIPDPEFRDWLRQVWLPVRGMTLDGIDQLIYKLTLPLLRTFHKLMLERTARLYLKHERMVRAMVGRAPWDEQKEGENERMRIAIVKRLRNKGEAGHYDADDAFQDAQWALREGYPVPLGGYLYLAPLYFWLYQTAEYKLVGEINKSRPLVRDSDGSLIERAGGKVGPPQARRILAREEAPQKRARQARSAWMRAKGWNEFFELAVSFNKLCTREPVRAIWKATRESAENERKIDYELLRSQLAAATGKLLKINALYVAYWRLRQRMTTLDYVMDKAPLGAPDKPGDASLLDWLAEKSLAASKTDLTTIRQIAALGRACCGEATLGWALLCRLLIEPLGLSRPEALAKAREVIEAAENIDLNEIADRIDKIVAAYDADRRGGLKEIHKGAKEKNILFFLVPAWYLIRVRGFTPAAALDRLNPEAKLADDLNQLLERIGAFGAIS